MIDTIISKEQFLAEHNKLSPANLKVTFAMLTQFQQEKKPLLKDSEWSHKMRMPLISWLSSRPDSIEPEENKNDKVKEKPQEQGYKNYPETHY